MLPADFWTNAIPTAEQIANWRAFLASLAAICLFLGGTFTLVRFAMQVGAYGWGYWRRPVRPHEDDALRRQQLDSLVELPASRPPSFGQPAAKGFHHSNVYPMPARRGGIR